MKIIPAIVLILFLTHCSAQNIVPFTLGPVFSMTSTSIISTPDFKDQVAGAGFNGGLFIRAKIFSLYAQGEVTYSSNRTSLSYDVNGSTNPNNVSYVLKGTDVSLLAGLKLFGLSTIGFCRGFVGYKWINYTDISYTSGGSVKASDVNTKNNNLVVGGGVDVWRFTIDLKYIFGLSDLSTLPSTDIKTREINLSVGYKFI